MPIAQIKFNIFVDIYVKCDIIKSQVKERKKIRDLQYFRNEKKIKVGTNFRRRNIYDTIS